MQLILIYLSCSPVPVSRVLVSSLYAPNLNVHHSLLVINLKCQIDVLIVNGHVNAVC